MSTPASPASGPLSGASGDSSPTNVDKTSRSVPHDVPIYVSIPTTAEKSAYGGLKAYTAYCIEINDFGKELTIERRFDDFKSLHTELITIDSTIPPLPEKKWGASTDAATVNERRPAFEKLLRHCLQSDIVVFDSNQHIWKFLELPPPAIVAARYVHKKRAAEFARQISKLLKEEYVKDQGYRLCHPSIVKTNLRLLTTEGLLSQAIASRAAQIAAKTDAAKTEADGAQESAEADGNDTGKSAKTPTEADLEAGLLDMLKYAMEKGTEHTRRCFVDQGGIGTVLAMILRIAKRDGGGGSSVQPDQRAKNVLNALIQAEGERYTDIFADFLRAGGMSTLGEYKDLCKSAPAFAEFVSKMLWLAWDLEVQHAFMDGGTPGADPFQLLGSIFSSNLSAKLMLGLLLSTLLANGVFTSRSEEQRLADSLDMLIEEELMPKMPVFGAKQSDKGTDGAQSEIAQAESLATQAGRQEKAFSRILNMATAVLYLDTRGQEIPPPAAPAWKATTFALWCLVKIQPKANRIQGLRPLLPNLAHKGPVQVRMLVGELLLKLHVSAYGAAGLGTAPSTSGDGTSEHMSASTIGLEQEWLETTMSERVNNVSQSWREELDNHNARLAYRQHLIEERKVIPVMVASFPIGPGTELVASLESHSKVCEKLTNVADSAVARQRQSTNALEDFQRTLTLDATTTFQEVQRMLHGVEEAEQNYTTRHQDFSTMDEATTSQQQAVEAANNEMREAEQAVEAMRKRILDMEQEVRSKQLHAQTQRTLASSDLTAQRRQVSDELESIKNKVTALREKAQKLNAGQPLEEGGIPLDAVKKEEVMVQLKKEHAAYKPRTVELEAQLKSLSVDPQQAHDNAVRAEQEATQLQQELIALRTSDLLQLEQHHAARREMWQRSATILQQARGSRDAGEFEVAELKRQLDMRWRQWQPLWSQRLKMWHDRRVALSEVTVSMTLLQEAVEQIEDALRHEQHARHEVLNAIARLQERLQELAHHMNSIRDLGS